MKKFFAAKLAVALLAMWIVHTVKADTFILWYSGFEEFTPDISPINFSEGRMSYAGYEGDDESVVALHGGEPSFDASCGMPSPFMSFGTNCLQVNTGTDPIRIAIDCASGVLEYVPQDGSALLMDSLAQFTVTPAGDDFQMAMLALRPVRRGLVMSVDNKLALYRQEVRDDATGAYSTNWCVVAGALSGENDELEDDELMGTSATVVEKRYVLESADPSKPIPNANVDSAWVRVSVRAVRNSDTGRLEFEIYLNGALAKSEGTTRFLSHPNAGNSDGITYLGFAGEGTVDNVVFAVEQDVTQEDVSESCTVTAVSVKPRWPWNGLVDIDYTLQVEPTNGMAVVTVSGCDTVLKRNLAPRTLSGEGSDGEPVSAGTHRLTWDIGMDYPQFHSEAFTVDVTAMPVQQDNGHNDQTNGLYMVIDLSEGTNAVTYPVSYLNEVPEGGWTTEHKTTKLVMRRIEPGTFMMGDNDTTNVVQVTLTKPFYMGVFEVTQKQYELVTGTNPSKKYIGDERPVETVSWNVIRGDSDIYNWPSNRTVDVASFMGLIQQKTGLGLDLPTEAQWEYACRAGTTSQYNNGGSTTNDLNVLGRYFKNRNDGKGGYSEHTTVGSYLPNVWGLYDMHGNVYEWCLDWYWYGSLSNGTDPEGPASGSNRVRRGGSYDDDAYYCRSAYRNGYYPSIRGNVSGFRLCCSAGL